MRLRLDIVNGHELVASIGQGRISRMALATANPGEMPAFIPSPTQLIKALGTLGLPQKKDRYPHPEYDQYILKTHILRSFDAFNYGIEMIYEWKGIMTISDSSTLSTVPTQIHPKDQKPLYVKWLPAGAPADKAIKKLLTLNTQVPMRHLVVSTTIDHVANGDVLEAFPSLNDTDWMGLKKGFWLYSGIEGFSDDDKTTYTYTATFTTKQTEDWSQVGFMTDDTGQPITVPEDDVATLRQKEYDYGRDESVNGMLKLGMFRLRSFYDIFGI
jgi:hypothetical protein